MTRTEKSKSGQVALFLVFLLAGLVLLFSLNVELFKSARTKLRLQNIADASAMTVARWQGMTLNMIGDLNFAHIKALGEKPADEGTTNFVSGITALQRHLKAIGPLVGFDLANRLARRNGARASRGMKESVEFIAGSTDALYASMIRQALDGGVYAGIDNVKSPSGILTNPSFYRAVQSEDFQALCAMGGYCHALPEAGTAVPAAEDMFSRDCIGYIGAKEHSFAGQYHMIDSVIDSLVAMSDAGGYRNMNADPANLKTNESIVASSERAFVWSIFDPGEWREIPRALKKGQFPWMENLDLNPLHSTMGGSCTVRIEDAYATTNTALSGVGKSPASAETSPIARFGDDIVHCESVDIIVAQSAAKAVGVWRGGMITEQPLYPPLIVPAFSSVRLVPYAFGANGRESTADKTHVKGFPKSNGESSPYQSILDKFHSQDFRSKAAKWYASHECNVVCRPPAKGNAPGGGTDRVP